MENTAQKQTLTNKIGKKCSAEWRRPQPSHIKRQLTNLRLARDYIICIRLILIAYLSLKTSFYIHILYFYKNSLRCSAQGTCRTECELFGNGFILLVITSTFCMTKKCCFLAILQALSIVNPGVLCDELLNVCMQFFLF